MPSKPCRNGASCEKPNCRFQHPPPQHEMQVKKVFTFHAGRLKGFHKIITESIPTFNVIFLTLLSPLTFIFKHFQAPNRLCKFGPDCQKPRCRFDHLPPPMAMPLLEYDLAPQGYNIQPTDTGHVQEVHWPLSY